MIGDIIIFLKTKIKQLICIHDYKWHITLIPDGHDFKECIKCKRTV